MQQSVWRVTAGCPVRKVPALRRSGCAWSMWGVGVRLGWEMAFASPATTAGRHSAQPPAAQGASAVGVMAGCRPSHATCRAAARQQSTHVGLDGQHARAELGLCSGGSHGPGWPGTPGRARCRAVKVQIKCWHSEGATSGGAVSLPLPFLIPARKADAVCPFAAHMPPVEPIRVGAHSRSRSTVVYRRPEGLCLGHFGSGRRCSRASSYGWRSEERELAAWRT